MKHVTAFGLSVRINYQPPAERAKKRRTRPLNRYNSSASAMGMPTAALGSVPVTTFVMSPNRLIARSAHAKRQPQRAPRHKPTAAPAQAAQTVPISTTAHAPMPPKATRARGLSRHIGSRKLPGQNSDTKERKLAHVPNRKKMLSAVMPIGRDADSFLI